MSISAVANVDTTTVGSMPSIVVPVDSGAKVFETVSAPEPPDRVSYRLPIAMAGASAAAGLATLLTQGRARGLLGAGAFVGGAIAGAIAIARGLSDKPVDYVVHLADEPSYEPTTPTEFHARIRQHWIDHAPPVRDGLRELANDQIIRQAIPFPFANEYVVTVATRNSDEFKARMATVKGVGLVEDGSL